MRLPAIVSLASLCIATAAAAAQALPTDNDQWSARCSSLVQSGGVPAPDQSGIAPNRFEQIAQERSQAGQHFVACNLFFAAAAGFAAVGNSQDSQTAISLAKVEQKLAQHQKLSFLDKLTRSSEVLDEMSKQAAPANQSEMYAISAMVVPGGQPGYAPAGAYPPQPAAQGQYAGGDQYAGAPPQAQSPALAQGQYPVQNPGQYAGQPQGQYPAAGQDPYAAQQAPYGQPQGQYQQAPPQPNYSSAGGQAGYGATAPQAGYPAAVAQPGYGSAGVAQAQNYGQQAYAPGEQPGQSAAYPQPAGYTAPAPQPSYPPTPGFAAPPAQPSYPAAQNYPTAGASAQTASPFPVAPPAGPQLRATLVQDDQGPVPPGNPQGPINRGIVEQVIHNALYPDSNNSDTTLTSLQFHSVQIAAGRPAHFVMGVPDGETYYPVLAKFTATTRIQIDVSAQPQYTMHDIAQVYDFFKDDFGNWVLKIASSSEDSDVESQHN